MKTLTTITALIAIAIMFSANLNASPVTFNEESYINDIPFNTQEVVADIIAEQDMASITFLEEDYINDIPFDTNCVSAECKYQEAVSVEFNFDEEEYIDDIDL